MISLRVRDWWLAAAVVLLSGCDRSLPTAVEIEEMDVKAMERRASSPFKGQYFLDGLLVDPDSARGIKASDIVAISIEWPRGAPGPIQRVTTRRTSGTFESDSASTAQPHLGMQWTTSENHVRRVDPTETAERQKRREFPGLIIVDGVVSDNASIKGMGTRTDGDLLIEVIKREWAVKLSDDPRAAHGMLRITTRPHLQLKP